MGQAITAERTQPKVPIGIDVDRDGGITGLTIVVRIHDGNVPANFLDFNDGVFKAGAHTTPTQTLTEVSLGRYELVPSLDLSSGNPTPIILPAATEHLLAKYDITAGGETGNDTDVIQLVRSFRDISSDVWDEILTGATHNINNSSGKILRQLKEGIGNVLDEGDFQAGGTTTTAVLALTAPATNASLPGSILVDNVQNTFWVITSYVGATKVATLAPDRGITPGTGNAYIVSGNVFSVPIGDQFNIVRSFVPVLGVARNITAGDRIRLKVHLEVNGERVALPDSARLAIDIRDRANTSLNSVAALAPVAGSGEFAHEFDPIGFTAPPGDIISVEATITLSGFGTGTHVGQLEVAVTDLGV